MRFNSYASHHFCVCFFVGVVPLIPRTEPLIGAMGVQRAHYIVVLRSSFSFFSLLFARALVALQYNATIPVTYTEPCTFINSTCVVQSLR